MKTLRISWQRLLAEGQTCDRCGATETELESARGRLEEILAPLEIRVVLEKQALSREEFAMAPGQSNRILIDDRPLEDWLQARVGQSACCGPCGDSPCRTLEVSHRIYETIPADLIIRAGLVAARQGGAPPETGCCG